MKNSEIKDTFKAKGLAKAKESMRVDSMGRDEKIAYNDYIKVERIRMGEIDTAIEDGKDLAKKELLPLILEERKLKEEANRQTEDERRQKDEAIKALHATVLQLVQLNISISKIAEITNLEIKAIEDIVSNKSNQS